MVRASHICVMLVWLTATPLAPAHEHSSKERRHWTSLISGRPHSLPKLEPLRIELARDEINGRSGKELSTLRAAVHGHRHRGPSSGGAFTLIEVLIVISVIGLLIGILIPILSSSRRAVAELRCVSNIRDSTIAVSLYASQCRDALPVPALWDYPDLVGQHGPRARITCGSTWIETDYFGPGYWWSAVLQAYYHEPPERTWNCSGYTSQSQLDPAFWGDPRSFALCDHATIRSTYVLSDAFLAAPDFWTKDSSQLSSQIAVQQLTSVGSPSRKTLLFETVILHDGPSARNTWEEKIPQAPVSFADGHASVLDFRKATPGVKNRFDPDVLRPMLNTEDGVLGVDF